MKKYIREGRNRLRRSRYPNGVLRLKRGWYNLETQTADLGRVQVVRSHIERTYISAPWGNMEIPTSEIRRAARYRS